MRGLGRHCRTALGLGGHFRTGALAMRRSNHAGSPPRFQRAVHGGVFPAPASARHKTVPCSHRGAGAQRRQAAFVPVPSSRLRVFACGFFPSRFCLTRRTDPLRKGCFAAMNWRSSMHAPGEGTRPSDPWVIINERVLSSLVAKKGPKTRSTRRVTG